MAEIPGAPISRHDLAVLTDQLAKARVANFRVDEIHVSSRRALQPFRVFGVAVCPTDALSIDTGTLISFGQKPIRFSFE